MMVLSLSGTLAVAAIAGVYFVEDRYLTDTTGVTEVEAEAFATTEDLQVVMDQTQGYLIDLRIEQARSRQRDLRNANTRGQLDAHGKQELQDVTEELQRLLSIKEKQR